MHKFFAKVFRMKYINRWALMRNRRLESVTEHSFEVSVLAHALAVIGNIYYGKTNDVNSIAVQAMFHDITEVMTGDMPTPVKYYNKELRDQYKLVEEVAREKLINALPSEMRNEYLSNLIGESAYVKAADTLSAFMKCREETSQGNNDFSTAEVSLLNKLVGMRMPEVDYFMENFVHAFDVPIDELERD